MYVSITSGPNFTMRSRIATKVLRVFKPSASRREKSADEGLASSLMRAALRFS